MFLLSVFLFLCGQYSVSSDSSILCRHHTATIELCAKYILEINGTQVWNLTDQLLTVDVSKNHNGGCASGVNLQPFKDRLVDIHMDVYFSHKNVVMPFLHITKGKHQLEGMMYLEVERRPRRHCLTTTVRSDTHFLGCFSTHNFLFVQGEETQIKVSINGFFNTFNLREPDWKGQNFKAVFDDRCLLKPFVWVDRTDVSNPKVIVSAVECNTPLALFKVSKYFNKTLVWYKSYKRSPAQELVIQDTGTLEYIYEASLEAFTEPDELGTVVAVSVVSIALVLLVVTVIGMQEYFEKRVRVVRVVHSVQGQHTNFLDSVDNFLSSLQAAGNFIFIRPEEEDDIEETLLPRSPEHFIVVIPFPDEVETEVVKEALSKYNDRKKLLLLRFLQQNTSQQGSSLPSGVVTFQLMDDFEEFVKYLRGSRCRVLDKIFLTRSYINSITNTLKKRSFSNSTFQINFKKEYVPRPPTNTVRANFTTGVCLDNLQL